MPEIVVCWLSEVFDFGFQCDRVTFGHACGFLLHCQDMVIQRLIETAVCLACRTDKRTFFNDRAAVGSDVCIELRSELRNAYLYGRIIEAVHRIRERVKIEIAVADCTVDQLVLSVGDLDIDADWDNYVKTLERYKLGRAIELEQMAYDRYVQRVEEASK